MTSVVRKIKRLNESLAACEILQAAERCPLTKGNLRDPNLPHAGQEKTLIEVHYDVHDLRPICGSAVSFARLFVQLRWINVIVHCN